MLRGATLEPMSLAMDAASGVSPARLALIQREAAGPLRPGLSHAVHLVLDGAGHNGLFQSDPRILERMTAFLKGEPVRDERLELRR